MPKHPKKMRLYYRLLLVFLLGFGGCKKEEAPPIVDFESTQVNDIVNWVWQLQHYNYQGSIKEPASSNQVKYIKFNSDSTFVGYTGCNFIDGIYHANDTGGIFFFSLVNATAAPCPTGTGEWHDIMSNQLLASKSFQITNNILKIVISESDTIDELRFIRRDL